MIFHLLQFIDRIVSKLIGILFLRIKFVDQDNVDVIEGGRVIFISNHQGSFDPFLITAGIKHSYFRKIKCFRYMTHYKYINMMWYGFFIWLSGAYPVYPGSGSLEKSLNNTIRILKDNQSVLMFPTGKRCRDCKLEDVRPGIAYLNKELNPTIVPVYIEGTYKINFIQLILRKRQVTIKYGKPFKFATNSAKDLRGNAIDIMQKVCDLK